MNRTERLYKIQRLLQSRKTVHISDFLRELEVSRATFRRDLEYLRDRLGAPIQWDREKNGYRLDHELKNANGLPGIWFSEEEIHGLLMIANLLSDLQPNDAIAAHIQPLKERLESIQDSAHSDRKELSNRIKVLPIARRISDQRNFQIITSALMRRIRIEIRHQSRQTAQWSLRQISPQQLIYYRDNWYLDAFCHLRDDLRSFSVDAIDGVTVTTKPAVSLPVDELQGRFQHAYGIFGGPKVQSARLRFSPFRARWVAREVWHPKQRMHFDEEGYLILTIPYSDDKELILDILRQGPDCQVLSPASLRKEIIGRLQTASKAYEQPE